MRIPKVVVIFAAIAAPLALIAFLGWGLWAITDNFTVWLNQLNPFAGLAQEEVEANVPAPENFNRFLTRDLESYFSELTGKQVTVRYELLRNGPSQAGIAYPKYYAWVSASDSSGPLEEGVVRVAAIDRIQFEVANYFSAEEIRRNPAEVHEYFGDDVFAKIEARLR